MELTQRVQHTGGASFVAPHEWEVIDAPPATLIALEPDRGGAFRANLVLTVVDNGGDTFRDWQATTDEALAEALPDYLLLDLEKLTVAGLPGGRRLAHHAAENGDALVMEQWFTAREGIGYTLTATIDVLRYDAAADDLASYGASLALPAVTSEEAR